MSFTPCIRLSSPGFQHSLLRPHIHPRPNRIYRGLSTTSPYSRLHVTDHRLETTTRQRPIYIVHPTPATSFHLWFQIALHVPHHISRD